MIDPYEYSEELRASMPKPRRVIAPFQWYGGKGNLAKWILNHIPESHGYVEPFAGAASVFWHLPSPRKVEVLNDLNGEIINVYRCLQDPQTFRELAHRLTFTPYARSELEQALAEDPPDPVGQAWKFLIRTNFGLSGIPAKSVGNWSRGISSCRQPRRWAGRIACLDQFHQRLRNVQIDNRDALEVIQYWDREDFLFYVDPPYVSNTRINKRVYAYEMTDDQHKALIDTLINVRGMVVLSGYDNPMYTRLMDSGWHKIDRITACHAAGRTRSSKLQGTGSAKQHAQRVESLWLNPACVSHLKK